MGTSANVEAKIAKLTQEKEELEKKFSEISPKSTEFFDKIKSIENYPLNYETYINELGISLNSIKDHVGVSTVGEANMQFNLECIEKLNEYHTNLEKISLEVNELKNEIENKKTEEMKKKEKLHGETQEKLNEIKQNESIKERKKLKEIMSTNNEKIKENIKLMEKIFSELSIIKGMA